MPRVPIPIESFGPELLAALLAGAKGRFEITLPYAKAVKFRQRIYQLRSAMRKANHEMAVQVSRTRVQILWEPHEELQTSSRNVSWPRNSAAPCKLIISPHDSEFADALAQSGIKAQALDEDPLDATQPRVPDAFKDYTS